MRARQLIDNASFGPEALKAIGEAFDAAWAEIAGGVGTDPVVVEAARLSSPMPCSRSPAKLAVTLRPSSGLHCKQCAGGGLSRRPRAAVVAGYAWATRPVRFPSRVPTTAAHTKTRGVLSLASRPSC